MLNKQPVIIYTKTDEAPALATYSLLPIITAFTSSAGINIVVKDISLAGRIIANFSKYLTASQRTDDALIELGKLINNKEANIVKLPNISASVPQLKAAIAELKIAGYALPDYPELPTTEQEQEIRHCYDAIIGSAVNPTLRAGNSDRHIPNVVKQYAKRYPHSMGKWSSESKTHVASMSFGDFYGNEKSIVISDPTVASICFMAKNGQSLVLRQQVSLQSGDIVDASIMQLQALNDFLARAMLAAKREGVLFSLHLKATMMKVADPIIFGQAVKIYFKSVFEKHAKILQELGVDYNQGIGDLCHKIQQLSAEKQSEINRDLQACYNDGPQLAMVDSDLGITNLHVPSDVIIDASMPAAIRSSGKMWGPTGQLTDIKAVIPDRSYAGVYQETINFCKENGAFDPATMGSVANIGLMAQKAEEYGSNDATFQAHASGAIQVIDSSGQILLEHQVDQGDIWRMCQTKDASINNWIQIAIKRAQLTKLPAVFWLDPQRAHDSQLIKKVTSYLKQHSVNNATAQIMSPVQAVGFSLRRMKDGQDTISVTGNVLRDYLTDLFPILEIGTSAKMLSIVSLINGGGLFETGSGGSAPKHVQQFNKENHLRWDSLGEFLALIASLRHLADTFGYRQADILATTLDQAVIDLLDNNRSPSRKVGELDSRGSHFYLGLYWAKALAKQQSDLYLRNKFTTLAHKLSKAEAQIVDELISCQGQAVDIGGYYYPTFIKAAQAMRPSKCLNELIGDNDFV